VTAWNGPLAPSRAAPTAGVRAEPAPGLFEPRTDAGSLARFEPGAARSPVSAPALKPAPVTSPVSPVDGWREGEYARVEVVDGRTLDTGDLRILIAGIGLPDEGQMCRTLDGRIEPCAVRARTQLELLTRSRTVACRTRAVAPGVAEGGCRIGASDLAERLLKTGFVHRHGDEGRQVAFVDVPGR
jgi:endonuclease YncB( thermonuclease family)